MRRRVVPVTFAAIAAMSIAAGCGSSDAGSNTSTAQPASTSAATTAGGGEPIKLGAVLSLTGPGASLGVQEKEALELMAKQVNDAGGVDGRQVELQVVDDKSAPDQAVTATRSMLQDFKPQAIIGGSVSATCLAMKPVTDQEKVVQYCLSAAPIPDPPNLYFSSQSPFGRWIGDMPMHWLKEQGIKSVGCIGTNDTSGQLTVEVTGKAAKAAGLEFHSETFNPTDTDVTPQLTKLRDKKPESLLICSTGAAAVTALQGINQLGFDVPVWVTSGSASLPIAELIKDVLPKQGAYTAGAKIQVADALADDDPQKQQIQEFAQAYQAAYSKPADIFAATAADAFSVLVDAIAKAGDGADEAAIAKTMIDAEPYQGLQLTYDFTDADHRGTDIDGVVEKFTPEGGFELVETYDPPSVPTYSEGG
jgi:branched-chain amino acid transport system substrate-binding protein